MADDPMPGGSSISNHRNRTLITTLHLYTAPPLYLRLRRYLHTPQTGNRQEYREVIKLYDRYATEIQELAKPTLPDEQEKSREAETDADLSRALLCAITAHAATDSFPSLLDTYIKTGTPRIPQEIRMEQAESLGTSTTLADKVSNYVYDLTSAHFVLNPTELSRYVVSLTKTTKSRSLGRLYENIFDGITRPNPFIAACDSHPSSLPVTMTDSTWAAFVSAFVRIDRPDLAHRIIEDLKTLKVRRGTATWTAHLSSYYRDNQVDSALHAWAEMEAEGVSTDPVLYQTLVALLFKAKDPRRALQMFSNFQEREKEFDAVQVLSLYNAVVNGLLRNSLVPQAEQFVLMMESRGHTPDVVTYNTFLNHFGRRQDFKNLLKTINRMEEGRVQGDVYSFSTILTALLKAGRSDAVDVVLQCMKEQGVQANVAVYSALIDNQLHKGEEVHWRAAMALLATMESNDKLSPNNITYTTVLTHLHRRNRLPASLRESYRRDIMQRMRTRGIYLSLPDYHILMMACFQDPKQWNTDHALKYYRDIKWRGIPYNSSTFYVMLSGLCAAEEWNLARGVVEDLRGLDGNISRSLANLVDKVMERTQ
ncbi:hypothetical protein DFP72DRAFT_838979 [Ephemerocybe angulata]|uniref:Pentacotripeptide-repeat region of PRORP domain-containing protein n=1 Tax=Ephemerocybe angulata TaxID=980116 RepID=A0A8H6MHH8_9AGAR|nr:hypothetical protein DFP72DRAFT_838979 [Tulosesus angulatus]